jgi:hypothetical protein
MFHSSDFCRYEWCPTNLYAVKPKPLLGKSVNVLLFCVTENFWVTKVLASIFLHVLERLGFNACLEATTCNSDNTDPQILTFPLITLSNTLRYTFCPQTACAFPFVSRNHRVCRQVTTSVPFHWISIKQLQYYYYYYFLLLFLVGWDWVHLVLRPLLAYCTSPGW